MNITLNIILALTIAVRSIQGAPAQVNNSLNDIQVLNFALTLEHLENAFYTQGLQKYSQSDFIKAGLPPFARALTDHAVEPCIYQFPDVNPKSFADVSAMLETVGASAYVGAAQLIRDRDYLTAAASILSTEVRQASWINSAVRGQNPWSTAFETPLSINQIYTIASSYIHTCPSGNAANLPSLTAFPRLSVSRDAHPGSSATLTFTPLNHHTSNKLFVAFISGLDTTFAPIDNGGTTVQIPKALKGIVFAAVTTIGQGALDDTNTVAGPTFLSFGFDSNGRVGKTET